MVRLELLVLGMGGEPLGGHGQVSAGAGGALAQPQQVPSSHPAWWISVPLLVGLAGADWVREPESRILCGRALTVACRQTTESKSHFISIYARFLAAPGLGLGQR